MIDYINYDSSEDIEMLEGANDVCSDFVAEFGEYNEYVCIWDSIYEYEDRYVPVYDADIMQYVYQLQSYIEGVIRNYGLVEGDLFTTFKWGYMEYIDAVIEFNEPAIVANIIIKIINKMLVSKETTAHDLFVLNKIDIAEVEDMVNEYELDFNNTYNDIRNVVLDYIAEHEDNSRDWYYENMKREVSLKAITE